MNVGKYDVPVMNGFRAERQTTVGLTITAIFDQNIIYWAIVWVFICPCSFSAFQHHSIVVYLHIATMHQYIVANIKVNRIARWSTMLLCIARRNNAFGWRIDEVIEIAHMFASVEMIRPEWRVDEIYILNRYILAV